MQGVFYGIGVGPGDPELLTYKAVRLLGEVDVVALPVVGPGKKSTAYKIAERFIGPDCRVLEIDFPMTHDLSKLEEAWEIGRQEISATLSDGESVAFITLGDPMLYSTYIYLYHHLQQAGYRVFTIPGINSFSAAAATAGVPLAFGNEKVAILPGSTVARLSAEELAGFQTLAIFKVASCFNEIVETLDRAGLLPGSVLVINCGQPGERIVRDLKSVLGEKLSYFSLIISRKEPVF